MKKNNNAAHLDQRVAVFIDTQNLYHSARSNFRANVNYNELMAGAVNGRKLIRAFAYVIKSEENTEEKFFDAIEEIGIEIRVKDLQVFHTGAKKADWDVGIAVDMIRLTEKVDVVVLASGDGDFIEVVRYCKSRGVRVEVMAFEKTTNAKLMEECDNFVDLGDLKSKYLIINKRRVLPGQKSGGFDNFNSTADKSVEYDAFTPTPTTAPAPSYSNQSASLAVSEVIKPYSGNNLSTVNRQANKNSSVRPVIFGKNNYRKIKPVVGLPAKPKPAPYAGRVFVNDQTKIQPTTRPTIQNAFGNTVQKPKKRPF